MSEPGFYEGIKKHRPYDAARIAALLARVSQQRVDEIAESMAAYISLNLPKTIRSKSSLGDYRTSPYVLMAAASALRLDDVLELSEFLVELKLYMGLETSFGKSIEAVVMGHYPAGAEPGERWSSPEEKLEESAALAGLSREEKAARRNRSVWREIDSACVHGRRRHLLTIKSGTSTINDTQVSGMVAAIRDHHRDWLASSRERFGVDGIDVVVGLTYGTDRGTNNKENQILAKLIGEGFEEADRSASRACWSTPTRRCGSTARSGSTTGPTPPIPATPPSPSTPSWRCCSARRPPCGSPRRGRTSPTPWPSAASCSPMRSRRSASRPGPSCPPGSPPTWARARPPGSLPR